METGTFQEIAGSGWVISIGILLILGALIRIAHWLWRKRRSAKENLSKKLMAGLID